MLVAVAVVLEVLTTRSGAGPAHSNGLVRGLPSADARTLARSTPKTKRPMPGARPKIAPRLVTYRVASLMLEFHPSITASTLWMLCVELFYYWGLGTPRMVWEYDLLVVYCYILRLQICTESRCVNSMASPAYKGVTGLR